MYSLIKILEDQIELGQFLLDNIKPTLQKYNGSLVLRYRGGKKTYYLQTYNSKKRKINQKYLGTEENDTVIAMKKNKFYSETVKSLESNILLIKELLPKLKSCDPSTIYENLPKSYKGIIPEALPEVVNNKIHDKANQEYTKLETKNFSYSCTTIDNKLVRSKGEVIIYNMLKKYNIPFRYEPKLTFTNRNGEKVVKCPDFLILLPNGKYMIWEHLGKLDDSIYRDNILSKIEVYHENDYILDENLILTSDNKQGGINTLTIQNIIENFIIPKLHLEASVV